MEGGTCWLICLQDQLFGLCSACNVKPNQTNPACGINYFVSAVLCKDNANLICSDGRWDLLANMFVGLIFGHPRPSACNVKRNQTKPAFSIKYLVSAVLAGSGICQINPTKPPLQIANVQNRRTKSKDQTLGKYLFCTLS